MLDSQIFQFFSKVDSRLYERCLGVRERPKVTLVAIIDGWWS